MSTSAIAYTIENPELFARFLARNREVEPLFEQAITTARSFFAPDEASFAIRIDDDPVDEKAILLICTALDPAAAVERLDAFDTAWLRAGHSYVRERFLITLHAA